VQLAEPVIPNGLSGFAFIHQGFSQGTAVAMN
jgi:hypothetical protein